MDHLLLAMHKQSSKLYFVGWLMTGDKEKFDIGGVVPIDDSYKDRVRSIACQWMLKKNYFEAMDVLQE